MGSELVSFKSFAGADCPSVILLPVTSNIFRYIKCFLLNTK